MACELADKFADVWDAELCDRLRRDARRLAAERTPTRSTLRDIGNTIDAMLFELGDDGDDWL